MFLQLTGSQLFLQHRDDSSSHVLVQPDPWVRTLRPHAAESGRLGSGWGDVPGCSYSCGTICIQWGGEVRVYWHWRGDRTKTSVSVPVDISEKGATLSLLLLKAPFLINMHPALLVSFKRRNSADASNTSNSLQVLSACLLSHRGESSPPLAKL